MIADVEQRLHDVYGATTPSTLTATYDAWAATYDADMLAIGYFHPAIIAALVTRYVKEPDAAILDAGVGTGSVGELLAILGYGNLSGLDMSQGMLGRAQQRNCYRDLQIGVLGETLNYADGQFAAIVSTGTFTAGHAPASAFDELARVTTPQGFLIFTVGVKVWKDQGFDVKLGGLVAAGALHRVGATPSYRPMPHSKTESDFEARAHVYQRT